MAPEEMAAPPRQGPAPSPLPNIPSFGRERAGAATPAGTEGCRAATFVSGWAWGRQGVRVREHPGSGSALALTAPWARRGEGAEEGRVPQVPS